MGARSFIRRLCIIPLISSAGVTLVGLDTACNSIVGWGELEKVATPVTSGNTGSGKVFFVSLGQSHTCVLRGEDPEIGGTASCWGRNDHGQLGTNDDVDHPKPTGVVGLEGKKLVWLSSGTNHVCAREAAGDVYCWGANERGQLGRGSKDDDRHPRPELVRPLPVATKVQSGEDFTCTETNEKEIYCWGANESGQLGDGTGTDSLKPKLLEGVSSVQKLSAAGKHACAAIGKYVGAADGGGPTSGVFCWGLNDGLQLGQPREVTKSLVPMLVPNVEQVKVFTGERHTCALATPLVCWGSNDKGQLGDGTQTDRDKPTPVSGISNAAGISAGKGHTCAITGNEPNFQLYCWGANDQGQVGRDTATKFFTKPEFIDFGAPVTESSARFNHSCAVSNGDLYCWGANDAGQLGDGTTEPRFKPFKVPL